MEKLGDERSKKYKEGHEFRHSLIYSLPYNIAYLYGVKRYNKLMRDSPSFQSGPRADILSRDIEHWLDYGKESQSSIREELYDDVRLFTRDLDSMENEDNIQYSNPNIEEDLFDAYNLYIGQMD
ncbi:MAG: hypothetical protein HUK20_01525 [Fibrobacter sp.]|nr:hypothetical protein [Fibrobacter sp.]